MTITVNGQESQDVSMLLGPAGEAYFVGEEVVDQQDNPYEGYEELLPAQSVVERQSRKDLPPGVKQRASSEDPHHLQGVLDGAGIDLENRPNLGKVQPEEGKDKVG